MLSAHFSDVVLHKCVFTRASERSGDDAINVKNARVNITDTIFAYNFADALDFDFVSEGSSINTSHFIDNGNDGIDVSGSDLVLLLDNHIVGSGDKGISIGEDSVVKVIRNEIDNNRIGIVAKDSSVISVEGSMVSNNEIGMAAYNKKPIFNGGQIIGHSTIFQNNRWNFGVETFDGSSSDTENVNQKVSSITGFASQNTGLKATFRFPTTEPKLSISSKRKLLWQQFPEPWLITITPTRISSTNLNKLPNNKKWFFLCLMKTSCLLTNSSLKTIK